MEFVLPGQNVTAKHRSEALQLLPLPVLAAANGHVAFVQHLPERCSHLAIELALSILSVLHLR